jgi:arginine exporter protein ArgO
MNDSIWHKIDAHLFRLLGLALGVFGVMALIRNNPQDVLFSDYYGIALLAIFAMTGAYSLFSIVAAVFSTAEKGEKNKPGFRS